MQQYHSQHGSRPGASRDFPSGAAKRADAGLVKRDRIAALGMAAALGIALVLAAIVLGLMGTGTKAIVGALRLTARWSFLLFWMAYAAGPLAVLFGPAFAPLARYAREFGLAYAAAQLVHLGLVVWLFRLSPQPPVSGWPLAFFAIGMAWTYVLAVSSFPPWSRLLGARSLRLLRLGGMNYILLAFADDFVHAVMGPGARFGSLAYDLAYVPFLALLALAPLLRLAAGVRKRRRTLKAVSVMLMRRAASGTPG